MIVVSDTTPLNYLILIDAVEVLPQLFDRIYAPPIVLRELLHPRTPQIVRRWATSPPAWLYLQDPDALLPSTSQLDAGEASAISLAKQLHISDLLIDEYLGRKVAVAEGLFVLPTIVILETAAEKDLLDLPLAIAALRNTSYRIRSEIIDAALRRDATRKRRKS